MARFPVSLPRGAAAGGRPAAAIEISDDAVVAAATPQAGQAAVYAVEPLPRGAILPSLSEGNVADPNAVAGAIRSALGQVQPRVKAISVVLPDVAVRVFVLDFDTLPSRAEEAMPVIRFRLRKSVPFDVEGAGVSYQVLSEGSSRLATQWKVLAAIIPGPVLAEYESVIRMAGYEPGAVLPSSIAVLAAIESQETVLAVNLSAQALTTSILSGNDILLHRTIELPAIVEEQQLDVQRSIAVASAFFEDKVQVRPHRLLYSGVLTTQDFALMLDDPELAVGEVVPRPAFGMASAIGHQSLAGVTGMLAGTN